MHACESSPDDHHMGLMAQLFLRWLQLKEEVGTGHGCATAIFPKGMNGVLI